MIYPPRKWPIVTRSATIRISRSRMVSWQVLLDLIEPYYPKSGECGRPPIGLERMLRMYIAQNALGLSDEGIEDAIYDSGSLDEEPRQGARSRDASIKERKAVVLRHEGVCQ